MQEYDTTGNEGCGWMVLFAGQGTAQVGMGANILDRSAATKAVYECASDISGLDVRKLCLKGPMARLTQTYYQQIAVTTINVASVVAIREQHTLNATACAGHSAGEYSALWLAGVFTFEALFKAIVTRASIMQRLAKITQGAMYNVQGVSRAELEQLIRDQNLTDRLSIACDNAPDRQVISGEASALKNLVHQLSAGGNIPAKLGVNGAWHSPLMAEGLAEMHDLFSLLTLQPPEIPVYMNRSARAETLKANIVDNLVRHLVEPVRWRESMLNCQQQGQRSFLEISPKIYLLSFIEENKTPLRKMHCCTLLSQIKEPC